MKPGIRVLGIDDSPFSRGDETALVIGVVCRQEKEKGLEVEGVLSTRVAVDGDDGTEKLIDMISSSRFSPQLHAIFLNGIMLAGFNAVDINELNKKTGNPVLALTRKKPDPEKVEKAVRKVKNFEDKLTRINSAGKPARIGSWSVQSAGTDLNNAKEIVCLFGNSPVRLAHIIASGVVRGESKGRA
jgi:endonuclease V-like protein UPF0215 family